MKKYIVIAVLFIGMGIMGTGYAALDLELTQGMSDMIPIALTTAGTDSTIANIVEHDLQNSGQIRIATTTEDEATWQKQKINAAVHIAARSIPGDRYRVNMTVTSVFDHTTLLQQNFTVDRVGERALAHHISDLIYQKLTGIRGIFSTKIAYILVQQASDKLKKYMLQVADADGFNPQSLLISHEPIMSVAWSADGKKIAYVSFEGKRSAIYTQDLRSGKRELVSEVPGINGAPAFSPDGHSLALVLTKPNNPKIYILDLKTKQLKKITDGPSIDTEPVWSPDGQFLLFTSDRGGTPQIYQYSFKTNNITRLTYQGDYNAHPSFVNDGRAIVMMHRDHGSFGIALQNLDTGDMRLLVQSDADESPSVAPNGQMVIYATEYGRQGILAQVSVDGRIRIRLPASDGTVQEPAWSPFLTAQ